VVVDIEVIAFPRDAILSHPFASEDGLQRFAETASRLDRKDETMFNLRD
jgi:hypothetical protein